jgi:hypothetical protein
MPIVVFHEFDDLADRCEGAHPRVAIGKQ